MAVCTSRACSRKPRFSSFGSPSFMVQFGRPASVRARLVASHSTLRSSAMVSPEIADAFEVFVSSWYLQVARVDLDLDDLDHLVLRTLHVELDLRVLVCGADR